MTAPDSERIGITPAGREAVARGTGQSAAATFVVVDIGLARLSLRASGTEAGELLADLAEGQCVEVRLVPCLDLADRHPLATAGLAAGWPL